MKRARDIETRMMGDVQERFPMKWVPFGRSLMGDG
jgi:hypothetical protein